MLFGDVAACHGEACVLCAVQAKWTFSYYEHAGYVCLSNGKVQ